MMLEVEVKENLKRETPAGSVPCGQLPIELLTPGELRYTMEKQVPTGSGRVTTLGNPVVGKTLRQLVEAAGRLVANRNVPGSGVTATYGTIDDTGKVDLS